MSKIKVRVVGVGSSREVEVEAEAEDAVTVGEALAAAGLCASDQGLNTSVNGESADSETPIEEGDQIVATPREAKLG